MWGKVIYQLMSSGQVWLTVCPLHLPVVIILYDIDWRVGRPRSLSVHESLYRLYLVSAHANSASYRKWQTMIVRIMIL